MWVRSFQHIGLNVSRKCNCFISERTAAVTLFPHCLSPAVSESCAIITATTSGSS